MEEHILLPKSALKLLDAAEVGKLGTLEMKDLDSIFSRHIMVLIHLKFLLACPAFRSLPPVSPASLAWRSGVSDERRLQACGGCRREDGRLRHDDLRRAHATVDPGNKFRNAKGYDKSREHNDMIW